MKTVFESVKSRPADKRKRTRNWNPEDIDNYTGPWGGFEDLQTVSKPEGEVAEYMEEYLRKRKKLAKKVEDRTMEEKTVLHSKSLFSQNYFEKFCNVKKIVSLLFRSNCLPIALVLVKKIIIGPRNLSGLKMLVFRIFCNNEKLKGF